MSDVPIVTNPPAFTTVDDTPNDINSTSREYRDGLLVSELFGPTIQGEGPSVGAPAVFLRLGGCNLGCVWCDEKHTWKWDEYDPRKELSRRSVQSIAGEIIWRCSDTTKLVVITGGEPLLQQSRISDLTEILTRRRLRIEIETAGTILPIRYHSAVSFNVSPKLEHSGNSSVKRYRSTTLRYFATSALNAFKFVVQHPSDFFEVDQIVTDCGISNSRVYIMPEGTTQEVLDLRTQELIGDIIRRGYRLTPRLHIQIWGAQRGH